MSQVEQALQTRKTETAVAAPRADAAIYESLALKGDISGLSPEQRVKYYGQLCERLGLDPYTQPFLPLKLNGKEVLYASRAATDQLARIHHVNREVLKREKVEDVYVVTVRATLPSGRTEDSIGAVAMGAIKGDALANALMKAETKAKRRATLAILGLGLLDESELETIPKRSMEHVRFADPKAAVWANAQNPNAPAAAEGGVAPAAEDEQERAALVEQALTLASECGIERERLDAMVNKKFQVAGGLDSLGAAGLGEVVEGLTLRKAEAELQAQIAALVTERGLAGILDEHLAAAFEGRPIERLRLEELQQVYKFLTDDEPVF